MRHGESRILRLLRQPLDDLLPLVVVELEALGIEVPRLQELLHPLAGVKAEARIEHDRAHLGKLLVLDVALDQSRRTTGVDLEVALLLVRPVEQEPGVVAPDVGLGDAVIE